MKKFYLFLMCLLLCGCFCPQYNDDYQRVSFEIPDGTKLSIKDAKLNFPEIRVKRSFTSLEGTLSKDGFEDKKIEIKCHFTNDEWAWFLDGGGGHPHSAILLLPPVLTIVGTVEGAYAGAVITPSGWGYVFSPFTGLLGAAEGFALGVGHDIYNLFTLAWPRAVLGNPWYEYDEEIDLTKEILTPTQEYKKECYSKKGTFIGNNDCLSCSIEKVVISTKEECSHCPNREWKNFECRLK